MDFAKAFDKVAHNRLLYKLSSYGVKGNTLGWIGSFLSGRSQKVVLTIHNSSDCIKLQEDLNNLERWESDWQMSFHPEKCEVIHITTKKKPIIHNYTLHGHTLSSVPQIKYLGVHISQDLKWNSHINFISSKANQTLGFLRRNLKINSQTIKEKAYKSIVRPKLEYCNSVWDPKCIKNPKDGDKSKSQACIPTGDGPEESGKVGNGKVP